MKKINTTTLIIVILIIGVIYYMGTQGMFKLSFNIANTINNPSNLQTQPFTPPNPTEDYDLSIAVNPNIACVGETVTGTINSNMYNAVCSIYVINNGQWALYKNVALSNTGGYAETTAPMNNAGQVTFRAICYLSGKYRISNDAILTVEVCNNNPPPQQDKCTDTDGGQNMNVFGTCTSTVNALTFGDSCEQVNVVKEYYCNGNICDFVYKQCTTGWWCVAGKCTQMECSQIHPANQADCDAGYCAGGMGCFFEPATLVTPAKCICGV